MVGKFGSYAVVVALVLATPALAAQSASPGSLAGTVQDESGGRVGGALVIVQAPDSPALRVVSASPDGRFALDQLPPGELDVRVTAAGFAERQMRVTVPAVNQLTVVLTPAPVVEEVQVVSASRQDELRSTLNTRVDVITRARIDESGAQTVGEVLRDVPGVVTRRGSEGTAAAGQQIQGIDSKQVLVLIDGVPLVGARGVKRGGAINLDRQSVERLDRVEVVKGASSSLYGSDAIGGVINLVTADARAPIQTGVLLSGGSRSELNTAAHLGLRRGAWSALWSAERHRLDGFDLTPTTFDTTAASSRRTDGFGKVRWTPSARVAATGLVTGYHNRATGRSNGELGPQEDDVREDVRNTVVSADWLPSSTTTLQVRGSLATYDEESTGRLAPPASSPLEDGRLSETLARFDASMSQTIGTRQHLQAGVEYQSDEYSGLNRLRNDSGERASTTVGWAQHRLAVGERLTATAGLRIDHHSEFGTAVSPRLGTATRLGGGFHARASLGRGFRAPDIGQLYYRFLNPTNIYQVIGNPALQPEYAHSLQVGIDYQRPDRRARFGVNVFRNEVRDLIESVSLGFAATPAQLQALLLREGLNSSFRPVAGRLLFTYQNINDARTQGVEVEGESAITRRIVVGGAYTYLDARDVRAELALTGRHRHHGHARVTWQPERLRLRATLRATLFSSWIAARTTSGADTVAPGFVLLDASFSQQLPGGLTALLTLENLADSQDPNTGVLSGGVPAPIYRPEAGRSARFGVRWSWSK